MDPRMSTGAIERPQPLRARTNNHVEGWQNRFSVIVGKYQPNLWQLIEALQKEQAATVRTLHQIEAG